mgnify:CR=1 FL=1
MGWVFVSSASGVVVDVLEGRRVGRSHVGASAALNVSREQLAVLSVERCWISVESCGRNPTLVRKAGGNQWMALRKGARMQLEEGDQIALGTSTACHALLPHTAADHGRPHAPALLLYVPLADGSGLQEESVFALHESGRPLVQGSTETRGGVVGVVRNIECVMHDENVVAATAEAKHSPSSKRCKILSDLHAGARGDDAVDRHATGLKDQPGDAAPSGAPLISPSNRGTPAPRHLSSDAIQNIRPRAGSLNSALEAASTAAASAAAMAVSRATLQTVEKAGADARRCTEADFRGPDMGGLAEPATTSEADASLRTMDRPRHAGLPLVSADEYSSAHDACSTKVVVGVSEELDSAPARRPGPATTSARSNVRLLHLPLSMPRPAKYPEGLMAITIRQPFASAIIEGFKHVENRGWAPQQLRAGSMWIAVHAGATAADPTDSPATAAALKALRNAWPTMRNAEAYPMSAVLGFMHIRDSVPVQRCNDAQVTRPPPHLTRIGKL